MLWSRVEQIATGGPGGPVEQLSDGQNRIGQSGLTESQFCINSSGGLTDGNGRGCIVTKATLQFQCDQGTTAMPGFSIASDGKLSYKSNSDLFACPTGDNGGFNIYTQKLYGEPGCVPVTLSSDNCKAPAPAPAPMTPTSSCPAELPAGFEYPHLIVPIDSKNPNTAYGTSYNGTARGSISSIFNFDIPATKRGKTCKLQFMFPRQEQLETSAFTFNGDGYFKFAALSAAANESTIYASVPKVEQDFGIIKMTPGNGYTVATTSCPATTRFGIWFQALEGSALDFFQDYNPCPIGLYVVTE
ncbi:GPI anchored cell wall protein [Zymoseptoria brevis]|uniref:GPI anchored cell wall protein n=1 Tax=Zymoseptoria brevis TaxID=1047168 RepID=A0A0F4G6M0_9PEZI|nr:GPI anchored cell wall protein [Zymoseptoria brevis]